MKKLKLVAHNGARVRHPRPIVTDYLGANRPAHSTTVKRAIVSAVKRIVNGDYKTAQIFDKERLLVTILRAPGGRGIQINAHKRNVL